MKGIKIWVNTIDHPSLLEFSKLCVTVKAKIIILPDVVLKVFRGNILYYE